MPSWFQGLILFFMTHKHQQSEHDRRRKRKWRKTERRSEGWWGRQVWKKIDEEKNRQKLGKVCRTEAGATLQLQQECCDNQLMSSSGFLYSSRTAGEFNSCSAEQKFSSLTQKLTLKRERKNLHREEKRREPHNPSSFYLILLPLSWLQMGTRSRRTL